MAIPASGTISLTDIQNEFGGSTPIILSNYYKGGPYVLTTDYAPNVPTSGPIRLSDFYGAKRTSLTTVTYTDTGSNYLVLPDTFVQGTLNVVLMTGAGGGGGGPDSYPGHAGYSGTTITGGTISASPGDVVNAYVGSGGGAGGSGGGGGGGGGKIICTKLYELGLMDKEIYLADQAFGAQLVKKSPDIYNGYRAWADIVVDWMSGTSGKFIQSWAIGWAQNIATPWAEEMAYKMKKKQSGSLTGKMITAVGLPLCKAVGVWQRVFGPSKKPAGVVKGAALIVVFAMFKLVAELGRLIEGNKL
jgi:hypothetical protein